MWPCKTPGSTSSPGYVNNNFLGNVCTSSIVIRIPLSHLRTCPCLQHINVFWSRDQLPGHTLCLAPGMMMLIYCCVHIPIPTKTHQREFSTSGYITKLETFLQSPQLKPLTEKEQLHPRATKQSWGLWPKYWWPSVRTIMMELEYTQRFIYTYRSFNSKRSM